MTGETRLKVEFARSEDPEIPRSTGCEGDTGPPGVFVDGRPRSTRRAEFDKLVSGVAGTERTLEIVVCPVRLDTSEKVGGEDFLEASGL